MKTNTGSQVELLAPAGDEDSLRAAVCAGANAVYLGFRTFGARASAANFDAEQLSRAVDYAHLYRVRVHVTVNTLVKEAELEPLFQALCEISQAGADAVIVQDLGVAALAHRYFPNLALHASTQMALHNASGARFAKAQGFERVVLARECTLEQIAQVAQTGVETEVFVHGALCAGVSGQCLMSSMAGGRSGNRGRCAQPCRKAVEYHGNSAALLSTRDLCLRGHLPELLNACVSSLKIEGRLKRPEYVAIVTDSYRRALDEIAQGRFAGESEAENARLRQIFHRGGFTAGHAMGIEDAGLCSIERVGHGGIAVGTVTGVKNGLAAAQLRLPLHDGDGLQLRGKTEVELRYAGKEREAGEQAVLRIRAGETVRVGDEVWRMTDAEQLAQARALMREPPISVAVRAMLRVGKPMELHMTDGVSEAAAYGECVQAAKTRACTEDEVCKQTSKLGDTPFCIGPEPIKIELDENVFAPVAALNALRREAAEKLALERRNAFAGGKRSEWATQTLPDALSAVRAQLPSNLPTQAGTLAVRFWEAEQAQALYSAGATLLCYAPRDLRAQTLARELDKLPQGTWLELPPQMSEAALQAVKTLAQGAKNRLAGVALGSVGQLGADFELPVAFGSGIPVTNRLSAETLLKYHPHFYSLWPEWSGAELLQSELANTPCLLTVYGRERLMLLNHCPERVARGLSSGRSGCELCKADYMTCGTENATLTDGKGYRFPLTRTRTDEGCVVNVLNALPTDLRRFDTKRRALGAGMMLSFTTETAEEQLALTAAFSALLRGEVPPGDARDGASTIGRFDKGAE